MRVHVRSSFHCIMVDTIVLIEYLLLKLYKLPFFGLLFVCVRL
jgi:hypothetical protein